MVPSIADRSVVGALCGFAGGTLLVVSFVGYLSYCGRLVMPGICPIPEGQQLIGEAWVPVVKSVSDVVLGIGLILMIIGFIIIRSDIKRKWKLNNR